MLKYRLISFPILIALAALIFWWKEGGVYIYCIIGPLALGLAVYEAAAMVQKINILTYPKLTGIVAALAALGTLTGKAFFDHLSIGTAIDLAVSGVASVKKVSLSGSSVQRVFSSLSDFRSSWR